MSIKKMSRKGLIIFFLKLWDIIDVINDGCPREFVKAGTYLGRRIQKAYQRPGLD